MSKDYPRGEGVVKWVSTEWLEEHLGVGDGELMLLDVQPNVHDYIQEHIPGAVYMNENLLRVPRQGLPAQYVPPESAQAIFRRLGLKADVPVVVYTGVGPFKGWGDGLEQTMVAYSLARFGHNAVYVLDGGIDKWKAESRPLRIRWRRQQLFALGDQRLDLLLVKVSVCRLLGQVAAAPAEPQWQPCTAARPLHNLRERLAFSDLDLHLPDITVWGHPRDSIRILPVNGQDHPVVCHDRVIRQR